MSQIQHLAFYFRARSFISFDFSREFWGRERQPPPFEDESSLKPGTGGRRARSASSSGSERLRKAPPRDPGNLETLALWCLESLSPRCRLGLADPSSTSPKATASSTPGLWPSCSQASGCPAGATAHPGSHGCQQPGPPPARLLRNAAPSSLARALAPGPTRDSTLRRATPGARQWCGPQLPLSALVSSPPLPGGPGAAPRRHRAPPPSPGLFTHSPSILRRSEPPLGRLRAAATPLRRGHAPCPPPSVRVRIQCVEHLLRRCVVWLSRC